MGARIGVYIALNQKIVANRSTADDRDQDSERLFPSSAEGRWTLTFPQRLANANSFLEVSLHA